MCGLHKIKQRRRNRRQPHSVTINIPTLSSDSSEEKEDEKDDQNSLPMEKVVRTGPRCLSDDLDLNNRASSLLSPEIIIENHDSDTSRQQLNSPDSR